MQNYQNLITKPQAIPQSQPVPGRGMTANNAGGYGWTVDEWTQLDRFLVLGSASGTFYVGAKELTKQNVDAIKRAIALDGARVVARVVEISVAGRAPSNDPALFVLALCAAADDVATRGAALDVLPQVARIPTHLFHFMAYLKSFRGFGRQVRRAVKRWYHEKSDMDLAYALTKYAQRDGWSHGDLIRMLHIKPMTQGQDILFKYLLEKEQEGESPKEAA